jgi:uncharacterized OB-fold protein
MRGVVYTETIVHAPPVQFVNDAPYQLVIVTLEGGRRLTGRVEGGRVAIDDQVELVETREGIPFFRKAG